ncbi:hypothetical protein HOD88_02385 [archaeon]|jgi:Flp pilus assembly protein protease CpaA|nr:hypothetical protein [archaeon]
MFEIIFLVGLAFLFLVFASIQDFKTTEISNWLVFSLAIFAIAFRFFYGLFFDVNFALFYQGLIGLGIFFILGNLMYYAHFFAGGDAKLMIALGAILPFSRDFIINVKFFIFFFLLFLCVGAIYGFFASIILATRYSKEFKKGFPKVFSKSKLLIVLGNLCGIVIMILGLIDSYLFILGVLIFILPYLYVYSKTIDEHCMIRKVKTKNLIEGDWLVKNLCVGKKIIKSSWDGLTKADIALIKKHHKFIEIRNGIAFAPVFLISFVFLAISYFFNFIQFFNWFF